ncbi:MAG TPA: histidine phosphatase family protein [Rhizomicrobium sp.]|jgi:probable phosphoglycerate mutase|nr:histidine phosphatase family protein [Rhizomicrobium sp.]
MTLRLPDGLTLYFARHGQTRANLEKRYSGYRDTPLTERGLIQAAQVGAALKAALGPKPGIDFVASPLRRARITMEIARGVLDLPPEGYAVDPRIQEIDLGAWDQLTDAEARALDPAYYDRRTADKWDVPALGGENYRQVADRLTAWAEGLTRDTFAVSHGAATRILRGLLAGLDAAAMSALDEPQGVVFKAQGREVTRLPAGADGPSALSNPAPMG